MDLHRQGRLDAALELYDAVVCVAPNFAAAHNNRGHALTAPDVEGVGHGGPQRSLAPQGGEGVRRQEKGLEGCAVCGSKTGSSMPSNTMPWLKAALYMMLSGRWK